jgi:hypothetical protein
MPWTTIITWIVTFLLSYSATGDAMKSALIATGSAALAYYTIEPTNPDAIYGDVLRDIFYDSEGGEITIPPQDPTDVVINGDTQVPAPGTVSSAWSFGETLLCEIGEVLESWGPLGTAGVIATTRAETSWLWLAAVAAVVVLS